MFHDVSLSFTTWPAAALPIGNVCWFRELANTSISIYSSISTHCLVSRNWQVCKHMCHFQVLWIGPLHLQIKYRLLSRCVQKTLQVCFNHAWLFEQNEHCAGNIELCFNHACAVRAEWISCKKSPTQPFPQLCFGKWCLASHRGMLCFKYCAHYSWLPDCFAELHSHC